LVLVAIGVALSMAASLDSPGVLAVGGVVLLACVVLLVLGAVMRR